VAPVVRPYDQRVDKRWAEGFLDAELGGRRQARRGELVDVLEPGLGLIAGDGLGLLTYRFDGDAIELSAIAAAPQGQGTGTALVNALVDLARARAVGRIWVVTTNDNLDALAFYQRRGFRLIDLRPGAVEEARRTIKPEISLIGEHGLELRDEIELALPVQAADGLGGPTAPRTR
jgi:GNAT superfamily N-acetyltransferase